jgi:predicted nuclease with TOPRIM domain
MCGLVKNLDDVNKLSDEEKTKLREWLEDRKNELQKQIDEVQGRITKIQEDIRLLR